jgi:acyl-CoA thioester hydrolase
MSPTPPEPRRLLHSLRMQVRWGDMDALGHVNNAEYLRYFEQSRIEWLEGHGYAVAGVGTGPILAKASVTYLKPLVYPTEIEIRLYAGAVGNSSYTLLSEIVNGRDATERFSEGEFVTVWVDYAAAKSVPIPDRLRAILTGGG